MVERLRQLSSKAPWLIWAHPEELSGRGNRREAVRAREDLMTLGVERNGLRVTEIAGDGDEEGGRLRVTAQPVDPVRRSPSNCMPCEGSGDS